MKRYDNYREKCYECFRPASSCMCEHFEHIQTQTKFIILMHPKEFKKVKNNTGRFTHKSLDNSELFIGIDFSDHKRINEIINSHDSYILFPSPNAVNLTNEKPILSSKPLAIFLIDSTWACSRKMFTLSTNLNTLKHMSFITKKTSAYEIKEQPKENYLSTIESTLVVLELLKKHEIENIKEEELSGFLNPFLKMVEYQKDLIENSKTHNVRFIKGRKTEY
ncbi:DTW domain-containing protein [Sulfurimonas sp. SAG-AH-194-C21]|nr:tRNA-uridine aminocarboxypropyltransferase [Sulfurimonas sp. SAG-AH-194-C21]MDF1883933.1 DTW domain-containing protein [Sulfurimonas sp. SAG-AH-194-C21]